MFDIKKYLDFKHIKYHLPGEKNVSSGWINIACPFCGDKNSWHFGINIRQLSFNCYLCQTKGRNIKHLIKKIEKCSWTEVNEIYEQFQSFIVESGVTYEVYESGISSISLPYGIEKIWPDEHIDFLIKKKLDPKKVINEYELKPVGKKGIYENRIIIPIFEDKKMLSYTARDVTGNSDIKYRDLSPSRSVEPVKHCIYNIDTVKDTMVIVEGASDVWNCGSGFVATMTSQFSNAQVYKIIERNPDKVFVMYDSDATNKSHKLANKLSGFINHVEVIELADGDPGELGSDDIKHLRMELGL